MTTAMVTTISQLWFKKKKKKTGWNRIKHQSIDRH